MSYGIGFTKNKSPLWIFYVEQGKNINQCLSAGALLFTKPIKIPYLNPYSLLI